MELQERNKLIEGNLGLVKRLARRKKLPQCVRYEELESAGYLGLVEAAYSYQEDKADFSVFAKSRIVGEMKDYLRKLNRRGNYVSLNEDSLIGYDSMPNDFIEKTNIPPEIKQIVCWYFSEDMTYKEIGTKLGVSEAYICKVLTNFKNKIKEMYTEIDLRQELESRFI